MFNAKYIGFDKYDKGSINLTCCALGHGAIPSLALHYQWTNLGIFLMDLHRDKQGYLGLFSAGGQG